MFALSIFSSEQLCVFPDYSQYFILKVALPSLFLVYLWYFSNKQCNFTTNKCEKLFINMRCWDSNLLNTSLLP